MVDTPLSMLSEAQTRPGPDALDEIMERLR